MVATLIVAQKKVAESTTTEAEKRPEKISPLLNAT
jgi:hypothetical protein